MKNKLKQITDLTIQEVLGNEIILPSTYFKTFDKNIKKIDKNLKNENPQKCWKTDVMPQKWHLVIYTFDLGFFW